MKLIIFGKLFLNNPYKKKGYKNLNFSRTNNIIIIKPYL